MGPPYKLCAYIVSKNIKISTNFYKKIAFSDNFNERFLSGVGKFYTFLHHKKGRVKLIILPKEPLIPIKLKF